MAGGDYDSEAGHGITFSGATQAVQMAQKAAGQPVTGFSSAPSLRASSSSMTGMPSRIGKARRSARQINSRSDLRYTKGPLQIGQTRISRSLESIQPLFKKLKEPAIEIRLDAQHIQLGDGIRIVASTVYPVVFVH